MAKYNITSQSQLIDIATINKGCNEIDTAAQRFADSAQKMYSASDILNSNALAVDKTTMQAQLDADGDYIKSIQKAITDFTLQIKNVAIQIYAEQQAELADYIAQQQAAAAASSTTSTSTSSTQNGASITTVTNADGSVTKTEVDSFGNITTTTTYPSGQQTVNYQPATIASSGNN